MMIGNKMKWVPQLGKKTAESVIWFIPCASWHRRVIFVQGLAVFPQEP